MQPVQTAALIKQNLFRHSHLKIIAYTFDILEVLNLQEGITNAIFFNNSKLWIVEAGKSTQLILAHIFALDDYFGENLFF